MDRPARLGVFPDGNASAVGSQDAGSGLVFTSCEGRAADVERRTRAAKRAVWDVMAVVEDLRCSVCRKRVDHDDRESFERTNLCAPCAQAVTKE